MNLLEKANTITTPTAYSNGFLHSVKPEVVLGEELVTNGDFATNSDWLKSSNVTISGGQATFTANGAAQYIIQGSLWPANTLSGQKVLLTYIVVSNSLNAGDFRIGGYTGASAFTLTGLPTTVGTHSITLDVRTTAGDDNAIDLYITSGATSGALVIDNVSVKEKIDADFTFTRNSSATRVGEDGYIQDVQIIGGELVKNGDFEEIGSELVTNGNFATDSDWSFLGTANISGGTANFPDTTNSFVIQSVVPFSVKQYKLQYDVTATNGGNLRFSGGSSAFGTYSLPNTLGTHIVYLQSNGTQNGLQFNNGGSFIGSIDNVSVKEVGQNWTFGTGWSISDGKASSDGTQSVSYLRQDDIVNLSSLYRIKFTVSNSTSGTLKYIKGNGGFATTVTNNGDYDFEATWDGLSPDLVFLAQNFVGSIDNISVKEVTDDTNLPRINYEGFEYQETLGSEEVINGDFSDGTSNWSVSNASQDVVNGELKIYNQTSSPATSSQTITGLVIGKKYQVTATSRLEGASGTARVSFYGQVLAGSTTIGQSVTQTIEITATTTVATLSLFLFGTSSTEGYFDNISVKEVIGDLPIYGSGKGHLLLEGQRTNVAYKVGGLAIVGASETSNFGISPSGDNDSTKLESTVSGVSYVRTSNLNTVGTLACSVFFKKGVGDYIQLLHAGNGNHYANYDLVNKVVTSSGSATTASIESYGDWLRLIAVFDSVSVSADFRCYLSDNPTAGYGGASSAVGNYIEYWGFQAEEGDYATSYIANTKPSTTVTRAAETCNNAGNADLFDSEGVLYAEIAVFNNDVTNRRIALSDGGTSNRIFIAYTSTPNQILIYVFSSGINVAFIPHTLDNAIEFNKIAVRYKDNDFSLWVNGVNVATDTSGTAPTGLSRLAFDDGNGSLPFYGKTKMVATFPYLSNDEMECLTGEGYGTFEALAAAYSYTIK